MSAPNPNQIEAAAEAIAAAIADSARSSGDCPIVWITGNRYMPPLRSFDEAEAIWQTDVDGEGFAELCELIERKLDNAQVMIACPEYDNAIYAVDLARFEHVEAVDGENLADDWHPIKRDAQPANPSDDRAELIKRLADAGRKSNPARDELRHHVTGAAERGEAEPIVEQRAARMYVVSAIVDNRQIPTFFLMTDVQGIVSTEHAERIAHSMFPDAGYVSVHATPTSFGQGGAHS